MRDEIIRMAREAGIIHPEMVIKTLEHFYNLAVQHEREECAKVCEKDDSMRWSGAADAIRARGEKQ